MVGLAGQQSIPAFFANAAHESISCRGPRSVLLCGGFWWHVRHEHDCPPPFGREGVGQRAQCVPGLAQVGSDFSPGIPGTKIITPGLVRTCATMFCIRRLSCASIRYLITSTKRIRPRCPYVVPQQSHVHWISVVSCSWQNMSGCFTFQRYLNSWTRSLWLLKWISVKCRSCICIIIPPFSPFGGMLPMLHLPVKVVFKWKKYWGLSHPAVSLLFCRLEQFHSCGHVQLLSVLIIGNFEIRHVLHQTIHHPWSNDPVQSDDGAGHIWFDCSWVLVSHVLPGGISQAHIFYSTPASEVKNKYPRHLLWLLWLYMWTMLGLFANFFFKNYTKKTPKSSASKKNL